jgi:hypothetical protein
VAKLLRGVQPAPQVEAEVLAAGVAVREERMNGEQRGQRQQKGGSGGRGFGGWRHDSL